MNEDTNVVTTPEELLAMGFRPIFGGSPEGDVAVEDGTADSDVGGESLVEGDEGAEQAEGDQRPGEGEQGGEARLGPNGERIAAPGGATGDGGEAFDGQPGGGRANDRIRQLVEQNRTLERTLGVLTERLGGGQGNGQGRDGQPQGRPAFAPPKGFEEFHGLAGEYVDSHFHHKIEPVAAAVIEMRDKIPNLEDKMDFYGDNPQYKGETRALIERARESLSKDLGKPIRRADALRFLRGTDEYKHLFVTEADRTASLTQGLVNARRGAARVNGTPTRSARSGEPDMSRMSAAERVKHIERIAGDEPI